MDLDKARKVKGLVDQIDRLAGYEASIEGPVSKVILFTDDRDVVIRNLPGSVMSLIGKSVYHQLGECRDMLIEELGNL